MSPSVKSASVQPAAAPARAIGEHLVLGQEGALAPARRPREGAVAADVAAERRQRDEDLGRVGDEPAAAPPLARRREQFVERRFEQRVHRQTLTTRP